jgi:hypothetical protein
MFAVLYRFKLKPGMATDFRLAWREATHAIRARYGTSGSRLHVGGDGELVAYAVWPDRGTWEKGRTEPSAAPEAADAMRACLEQPPTSTPLEVLDDLLVNDSTA